MSFILPTEVKKAARENSPKLRALLTLISPQDVLHSCFKEALLEASRAGHLDAICSLVLSGGRHSLHLKDCIVQALQGHFCEAAAMLLACYAAKHDKKKLLKYLLKEEMSREEEQKAIAELPAAVVPTEDDFARIRYLEQVIIGYISNKPLLSANPAILYISPFPFPFYL